MSGYTDSWRACGVSPLIPPQSCAIRIHRDRHLEIDIAHDTGRIRGVTSPARPLRERCDDAAKMEGCAGYRGCNAVCKCCYRWAGSCRSCGGVSAKSLETCELCGFRRFGMPSAKSHFAQANDGPREVPVEPRMRASLIPKPITPRRREHSRRPATRPVPHASPSEPAPSGAGLRRFCSYGLKTACAASCEFARKRTATTAPVAIVATRHVRGS